MQVDHLENLFQSVPKSIANVLFSISKLYDQLNCNSHEDEVLDIKETTEQIEKNFSLHRRDIYKECNHVLYSLERITEELKIAQKQEKFHLLTLEEIKSLSTELSASIEKHQNKNAKVIKEVKVCKEKADRKERTLLEEIYSFDVQSLVDIAAVGATTGFTFWGSISASMTTAEIAAISISTGGGIVAAAIFVTIALYFLFKYIKNLKTNMIYNELKNLAKSLSGYLSTAKDLESTFFDTVCDLEMYLQLDERAIQFSTDATPDRVVEMTESLINDTNKIHGKFSEIKNLASKAI